MPWLVRGGSRNGYPRWTLGPSVDSFGYQRRGALTCGSPDHGGEGEFSCHSRSQRFIRHCQWQLPNSNCQGPCDAVESPSTYPRAWCNRIESRKEELCSVGEQGRVSPNEGRGQETSQLIAGSAVTLPPHASLGSDVAMM
jgi:hypothetical protein